VSSLQVTFEDNYVHIAAEAPGVQRTPEMVADALLRAMELCAEHRCFRILAENERPLRHVTRENVEQFVQRLAFFPGLKVAVSSGQYVPSELTNLYVDLARQHGTSVRYFTDRDEALQWLGAK
jgi:hypothetical protein